MEELMMERMTELLDELEELKKSNGSHQLIAQQERKIAELEAHISTQDEQIQKLIVQNEELLGLEGKTKELDDKVKTLTAQLNAKKGECDKLRHELELVNGEYKKAIREIQSTLGSVASIDREAINNSARSIEGLMRAVACHWMGVAGAFLFCLISSLASAYTAWKFKDYDGLCAFIVNMDAQMRQSFGAIAQMLQQ